MPCKINYYNVKSMPPANKLTPVNIEQSEGEPRKICWKKSPNNNYYSFIVYKYIN